MTIGGWIAFVIIGMLIAFFGVVLSCCAKNSGTTAIGIVLTIVLIIGLFCGMKWYFNNTASGSRALIDQKSNLSGGIERVVNVYTANGDLIAEYKGKIDIDTNDGGYVKFDFDGKRYIYYNCFIETIADISGV